MSILRTRCPQCKRKLTEGDRIHKECIAPYAEARAEKAKRAAKKRAAAAARIIRQEDAKRREDQKSLRELLAEAQEAFNAFIRLRDAGLPCICCGSPFEPMKPGGSMDAGHFRSRSTAPHIRFNEDNVFGQRKNCNRPGGTTYAKFRAGVLTRIGQERLEAIEANNTEHKWTRDEVRGIRDTYRAKTRQLKKECA